MESKASRELEHPVVPTVRSFDSLSVVIIAVRGGRGEKRGGLSAYARQFLDQMEKPDVESIEGLSPAISIEQKTDVAQPALDRRHRHRDLRLPAAAVRTDRQAPLSQLRQADRVAVGAADRRRADGASRRQQDPGDGADRPRPQGDLQEGSARGGATGLRPGAHRRQAPRSGRRDRPGQAEEAHDRDRRRPADRQAGAEESPDRFGRDRAGHGRRVGGRGHRRRRGPAVLAPPGLHRVRRLAAGAGPADVLVQLALRRLSRVRRPGGAEDASPGPRACRRRPASRLREGALAWGDANWYQVLESSLFKAYKVDPATPYAKLPARFKKVLWEGSGTREFEFTWKGRRSTYKYRKRWEGMLPLLERRYRETDSERRREELEKLMAIPPLPRLRRRTAAAGEPGGQGRQEPSPSRPRCRSPNAARSLEGLKLRRARAVDRRAGPQGDPRAPGLSSRTSAWAT